MKQQLIVFTLLLAAVIASPQIQSQPSVGDDVWLRPGVQRRVDPREYKQHWAELTGDGIFFAPATPATPESSGLRDCDGDCWDLQHIPSSDTQWYLGSGAAYDTLAVAFNAGQACTVEEVYFQWFNDGIVTAFAALMGAGAVEATNYTGASVNLTEGYMYPRGTFTGSPIGELLTEPTENIIEGYSVGWESQLDIGGSFQMEPNTPFLIVIVKQADNPNLMAADVFSGESYNWFGGPWTDHLWGNYQSAGTIEENLIDIACLVRVQYPWGPHPAINLFQHSDTYQTAGPAQVMADIFFPIWDYWPTPPPDTSWVNFHWAINGIEQPVITLPEATQLDVDEFGCGLYQYDLNYDVQPVTAIGYWIEYQDYWGVVGMTTQLTYFILEPEQPCAELLVVDNGRPTGYTDAYEDALDQLGIVHEYWNEDDHNGLDSSVINFGWNHILVHGDGCEFVPVLADHDDPGFGEFIDGGGQLILLDEDWFFTHDLAQYPVPLEFFPGDPAYEWFGLAGAFNDPDYDNLSPGGEGDTLLISQIPQLPFANEPYHLVYNDHINQNWGDWLLPGSATSVFEGYNSSAIMAVQWVVNPSANIYCAFDAWRATDPISVLDTRPQVEGLVEYLVSDVPSLPVLSCESGECILPEGFYWNGDPQLVSVTISGGDYALLAADLCHRIDDGQELCEPLEVTDNQASGTLPEVESGALVEYWFRLYDLNLMECNVTESSHFQYSIYRPTSEILLILNSEITDNQYPGMYYLYDWESGSFLADVDFWTEPLVPEILDLYDTVIEITTTYNWSGFEDHYALIDEWLEQGDRNYIIAGDEFFGMLTDWTDTEFSSFDFWYEMGVAAVTMDVSDLLDPSLLAISETDLLTAELYAGLMENQIENLYYDPCFELTTNNRLDGMVSTEESIPCMWDVNSGEAVTIRRQWPNGNRTVVMTLDPLGLNSDPYIWWGASVAGLLNQSLLWFDEEAVWGDINGDSIVNILDIIPIIECIIGVAECTEDMDLNGDGGVDVMDVVMIVAWIMGP